MVQLVLLVLGGLAVGASLGFLGGGGTILTVPILLLAGAPAKQAIAVSLAVVAATAAVASPLTNSLRVIMAVSSVLLLFRAFCVFRESRDCECRVNDSSSCLRVFVA